MEIVCKFDEWPWIDAHRRYTCNVKKKIIPDNTNISFNGKHLIPHTNYDVTAVNFMACRVIKIPNQVIIQQYPLVQALALSNCGLRSILKEDLSGLTHLKVLWLNDNDLEYLPGDLFEEARRLEYISFEKNKIRYIDGELLDNLADLKLINFFGNAAIDKVYNSAFLTQGNASLKDVKSEILIKCKPPWRMESNSKVLEHEEALSMELYKKVVECDELSEKCRNLELEVDMLKVDNLREKEENEVSADILKILQDENFKDFTILAKGEKFQAHKFILAARSPVLAMMIQSRPDAETLTLTDIPVKAFKVVLNYIYTNELPNDNEINFVDVFTSSTKLKIEKLRDFCVEKIKASVDEKNALEILILANKHENKELQVKAFAEIQKSFPEKELKAELAMQPEKIKKLLEMKQKLTDELENM